jgi:hypothetical protein
MSVMSRRAAVVSAASAVLLLVVAVIAVSRQPVASPCSDALCRLSTLPAPANTQVVFGGFPANSLPSVASSSPTPASSSPAASTSLRRQHLEVSCDDLAPEVCLPLVAYLVDLHPDAADSLQVVEALVRRARDDRRLHGAVQPRRHAGFPRAGLGSAITREEHCAEPVDRSGLASARRRYPEV